MFAGMVRMKSSLSDADAEIRAGGPDMETEDTVYCRRSIRPGYMRADLLRQQECDVGLTGRKPSILHTPSGAQVPCPSVETNSGDSIINVQSNLCEHKKNSDRDSVLHNQKAQLGQSQVFPSFPGHKENHKDIFSSNFSFIQLSLDMCNPLDIKKPRHSSSKTTSVGVDLSDFKHENPKALQLSYVPVVAESNTVSAKSQKFSLDSDLLVLELDTSSQENGKQISSSVMSQSRDNMPDSDAGSLEITSNISVDSDSASASSMTSGYESATSTSDQIWDDLIKKYEDVISGCLQENRANFKIESMMLTLQRLQGKAISDDDYDLVEHFGKKLEALRKEQTSLKPGLPSRNPKVACLLQYLRMTVRDALRRIDSGCRKCSESTKCHMLLPNSPEPQQTRKQILEKKEQIQMEMEKLQHRLQKLQKQSQALEERLKHEDMQEVKGSMLQVCSPAQLRMIDQALEDLITSKHRAQISFFPSPRFIRCQDQEQALNSTLKDATAKAVMSQKLGGSLQRKVCESETQLLALHEAAISGSDFDSAKELKAEIRSVYRERNHLEGNTKMLQAVSTVSTQDLAYMKEQHSQHDLHSKDAQYEHNLKENTLKYIELLEDKLQKCLSPVIEHILEADMEACHLFLRALQLRAPNCLEMMDLPSTPESCRKDQAFSKVEQDSAIHTALERCWGPEAILKHSVFTKKLEEFMFCLEDRHFEDLHCEAAELKEQCQLINDRLLHLEEQLQSAMQHSDQDFTIFLEKEILEVKSVLQEMLAQLKEKDEQQEHEDEFHDMDDKEDVEVEEDAAI